MYPISEHMGVFRLGVSWSLLDQMKYENKMIMFIGLIFDLLLIIFVIVSCLLIYSLLLISVETKAYEIGVMRLVGLNKYGFVGMIMT